MNSLFSSSLLREVPRGHAAGETAFRKSLQERAATARSAGAITIVQAFGELMTGLEPTESQRTEASEQQRRVRAQLLTRLHVIATYLSGSYRRQTMTQPVQDIDLLVVLDATAHGFTTDAAGATKALDLVLAALDNAYPKTEKRRDSRCIVMQFAGTGIGFDIVPVVQFADHEFWMPDERRGMWIRTNPREVQRLVSEANQGICDGWLVPLVKLLKRWCSHCKVPLRGFHLEALAYHALQHAPKNEREGLLYLFDKLRTNVWFTTADIWPTGEAVSAYLNTSARLSAAELLGAASDTARAAVKAEVEGLTSDAHALWYSLFGDRYPETGAARAAAAAAPLGVAASIFREGRPFSATSAGVSRVVAGYASVVSATGHGGVSEAPEADSIAEITPDHQAHLELEIARTLGQFTALVRVDVAHAVADGRLWPVKPGDERRLYAVLVGTQRTNYGTSHEILVSIAVNMPAREPRVYLLRQHVDALPVARHGAVRFVVKRKIAHQWADGAMCSRAMRDAWDGRLVTMLVYAAGWLFRQEHYRRTGRWLGHEIDGRRRHLLNGKVVGRPPQPQTPVVLRDRGRH